MTTEFENTWAEGETPPAANPAEALREQRVAESKTTGDAFAEAWTATPPAPEEK